MQPPPGLSHSPSTINFVVTFMALSKLLMPSSNGFDMLVFTQSCHYSLFVDNMTNVGDDVLLLLLWSRQFEMKDPGPLRFLDLKFAFLVGAIWLPSNISIPT